MKISTEIISAYRIVGEEKAVETIAKAGFDAWDFSISCMCDYDYDRNTMSGRFLGNDYLKIARRLRQIGEDCGIYCNQSHAPNPSDWACVRSTLKRALECTAEAGGKYCIIHPCCQGTLEENVEMYQELLPFAKECGVKMATENMFGWDYEANIATFAPCATPASFNEHLDGVDDPFLVACLDIGHAEMRGSGTTAAEMVKALGSRLHSLHIHDNDKHDDFHQIPFSMNIDFVPIVKALKEIGYSGEFTLEASAYLRAYDQNTVLEGATRLAQSARRLADMFEQA